MKIKSQVYIIKNVLLALSTRSLSFRVAKEIDLTITMFHPGIERDLETEA